MQKIKNDLLLLEEKKQYRKILDINFKENNYIFIEGNKYLNFASNDYLNISTKRELFNEFLEQNSSLPSSASARLLSGSSLEYKELESTLASLFNKEACLIFNSGYQCNIGVISALIEKKDVVFSDKLNHASIIDGMKLADGDFYRYKHLDYDHLEQLLEKKRNKYNRALIISESIFSMDGDIADIKKLIDLKKRYNCLLMIDEAHAFSCYGMNLSGVSYNLDVDIITATLGKALGSFGAFCVSNKYIIDYLINKSRSFIFSTSIPPINVAWSNWLLTKKQAVLLAQKNKLNNISIKANKLLGCSNSDTHILPVIVGSNDKTLLLSEKLKSEGYYIPAIRPPTVPDGSSRLRISLTADTKYEDFEKVIKIIHEL